MKIFYQILKKNPGNREDRIEVTSLLGILVNFLIAGVKIVVGLSS